MKYLLAPLTAISFLLFNCVFIFSLIWIAGYSYSLSWFWFVLSYGVIGLVLFTLGQGCILTMIKRTMNFYNYQLIPRIIHSVFAFAGIIIMIYFYTQFPPMLEGNEGKKFIISAMWDLSPFKLIVASVFIAGLSLSVLYFTVIETLRTRKIKALHDVGLFSEIPQN
jgi:hypothetical protein